MKKILTLLAAYAAGVPALFAWGQKGHDTVAAIAERHLTPATAAAIDSLLGGKSIVYYANWLDNASHTPKYAYSKTWHYKNIDADQTYETAPKNAQGDVVTALNREIGILMNPRESRDEHELAVKMIVHLVGDAHQPMHLGRLSDLGGNKTEVKYFDRETNLHSVWDSSVLEGGHKWSFTEWAEQLDRVPEQEQKSIVAGDIDDWARESYDIARQIYYTTPPGTVISYDYIAEWTPVIESRLTRAGLRLAEVLNSIFDPSYARSSSVKFEPYVRK